MSGKTAFDFLLALFGLFLFLPLWLIIMFCIYIDDGLPIYYFQERIGKGGVPFKLIKFRSMRNTGDQLQLTSMARILRQTALDELPQLLNILKGQMSFVGPRPITPQEYKEGVALIKNYESYSAEKPGLTGPAQIYAEKFSPYRKKLFFSYIYTKRKNLFLDLRLIIISLYISITGRWDLKGKKT